MDPATDLAIAGAVIAAIEKIIAMHNAAKAGVMTGAEILTRLDSIQADLMASEIANDAAADAIVKQRFGDDEKTPVPQ